jgi:hypothetical protein
MVTMLAMDASMEKGQEEIAGLMDGWMTMMTIGTAGDASVTDGMIEEIGMIVWSAGE